MGGHGTPEMLYTMKKLTGDDPFTVTQNRVTEMIVNYLNGLAWVYAYYLNGIDFVSWNYLYRYFHAPLFEDLSRFPLTKEILTDWEYNEESYPFNTLQQLLAVIPPKSKNLLPFETQALTDRDSPIYDMFPRTFVIERYGENEEKRGKGIPIVPAIEYDRIRKVTGPILDRMSTERREMFLPTEAVMIQGTPLQGVVTQTTRGGYRGRGRGEYQERGRGYRGRGESPRGGYGRGRGEYQERGRGEFRGRGRGRGEYQTYGRGRGESPRGGYRGRGEFRDEEQHRE